MPTLRDCVAFVWPEMAKCKYFMHFLCRRGDLLVSCYLCSNNGVLIALFSVFLQNRHLSCFCCFFFPSWFLQARTILLSLLWKLVVQLSRCVEEVDRNMLFTSAH